MQNTVSHRIAIDNFKSNYRSIMFSLAQKHKDYKDTCIFAAQTPPMNTDKLYQSYVSLYSYAYSLLEREEQGHSFQDLYELRPIKDSFIGYSIYCADKLTPKTRNFEDAAQAAIYAAYTAIPTYFRDMLLKFKEGNKVFDDANDFEEKIYEMIEAKIQYLLSGLRSSYSTCPCASDEVVNKTNGVIEFVLNHPPVRNIPVFDVFDSYFGISNDIRKKPSEIAKTMSLPVDDVIFIITTLRNELSDIYGE